MNFPLSLWTRLMRPKLASPDQTQHVAGVKPLRSFQNDSPYYFSGIRFEHTVYIDRPLEMLYSLCRSYDSVVRVREYLRKRTSLPLRRGWPDTPDEWEAALIEDVPNELISW